MKPQPKTLLLAAVERIANKYFDGHYTLLSFTTNCRGCYGTPPEDIRELEALPAHSSMEELLYYMAGFPFDYFLPLDKEAFLWEREREKRGEKRSA